MIPQDSFDDALEDDAYDLTYRRVLNTQVFLTAVHRGAVVWIDGLWVASRLQAHATVSHPE